MKRITILFLTALMLMSVSANSQNGPSQKPVKFVIHTDFGDMTGVLYNETPKHRDNFKKLVEQGYFNDLLFHRVISGFMIQGGDPDSKNAPAGKRLGMGGPGYTVDAEINPALIHKKGALSAARLPDQINPKKASSGSQFYIVQGKRQGPAMPANKANLTYTEEQKKVYQTVGGTPFLDGEYTVFGEITEGLDVIDKIAAVQKDANDRPLQDVKMTIKIVK